MGYNTSMWNFDFEQENVSDLLCNSSYYFSPGTIHYGKIVDQFLYLMTGILGIPGNLISMIIFSQKKMRSLDSFCLVFVAFFDNLYLFTVFYRDFIGGSPIGLSWTVALGKIAWGCSIWATVCFLATYYVSVCFRNPKGKTPWNHKTIALLNLFILLLTICYNIPHFCVLQELSWDVDLMTSFPNYFTSDVIRKSHRLPQWLKQNALIFEIWCIYLEDIFLFFVPPWLALGFSCSAYLGLFSLWKNRRALTLVHQTKKPRDKIWVNFLITSFFTYFYTLIFVVGASKIIPGILPRCRYLSLMGFYLVCTISGFKFLLYVILWKDFRTTLGRMIGLNRIFTKRSETKFPQQETLAGTQTLVLPKHDVLGSEDCDAPKTSV